MKQFTTAAQTAKLIDLGFEKPKSVTTISWDVPEDDGIMINANSIEFDYHYSIGELIEMLPPRVGKWHLSIDRYWEFELWVVYYEPSNCFCKATELRDALYYMIIKLKRRE